jgi:hypothetical protein
VYRSGYHYDNERLIIDVSNSVYALRNQVTPRALRHLWAGFCNYLNICLKSHKVLAPNSNVPSTPKGPHDSQNSPKTARLCCCRACCCLGWAPL